MLPLLFVVARLRAHPVISKKLYIFWKVIVCTRHVFVKLTHVSTNSNRQLLIVNSSNQLTELPREVCQMPLQVLLLCDNMLMSLPKEIGKMTSLAELDASNNRLTQVPMTLGDCAGMRALDLSNNQLGLLPLREYGCVCSKLQIITSNNWTACAVKTVSLQNSIHKNDAVILPLVSILLRQK